MNKNNIKNNDLTSMKNFDNMNYLSFTKHYGDFCDYIFRRELDGFYTAKSRDMTDAEQVDEMFEQHLSLAGGSNEPDMPEDYIEALFNDLCTNSNSVYYQHFKDFKELALAKHLLLTRERDALRRDYIIMEKEIASLRQHVAGLENELKELKKEKCQIGTK